MVITDFFCWVVVIGLAAAFLLSLARKWGWLEWAQVHAPNEFISKLLNCPFCCSWWVCVAISVSLYVVTGHPQLLAAPICSTLITRAIW